MTSPGAVFKNLLIIASRVNETYDASPGHIRAYDTVTGEMKWIFHTIPAEGEVGHDTWKWVKGETYGGANAWGGLTIDEQRGWVFAATGSATDDFYGGFRKGSNLFANCVIALDASTGERKWHYQTVHHDLWDYDNPPAPILVTLRNGTTHERCRRAIDEDGFHVRARPRHRRAVVPGPGGPRSAIDRSWRRDVADAVNSVSSRGRSCGSRCRKRI